MRILFTNDDGYDSIGLHAVADLFCGEHEIAVVAPSTQRSGYSHSLSMHAPVTCEKIAGYDYPVFALDGTPVDCVKFAYTRLFPTPDIVVSGINRGRNLGSDVMYSGTVSAASEGAYLGLKSFALSLNSVEPREDSYRAAAKFFARNFDKLCSIELPKGSMFNINFPSGKPKGVKAAKMSFDIAFDDAYNPRDGKYMYIGAKRTEYREDTDEMFCENGYVTITPLTIDRTDRVTLEKISKEKFEL